MVAESNDFSATLQTGSDAVLTVAGDIDLAAMDMFMAAVDRIFVEAPRTVTLDLESVTFLDSSGIKALLKLRRRCEVAGAELHTTNIPDNVHRLLGIMDLADLFVAT